MHRTKNVDLLAESRVAHSCHAFASGAAPCHAAGFDYCANRLRGRTGALCEHHEASTILGIDECERPPRSHGKRCSTRRRGRDTVEDHQPRRAVGAETEER